MNMRTMGGLVIALALAACSAAEEAPTEPEALALTPGAWAANDSQASYADESGALLATFRCDSETQELILEMPGDFSEGARPAMMLRAGDFMHGVDPVSVSDTADGPVRLAPMPVSGPLAQGVIGFPAPLTIESDGGEPLMIETDEVLQGYFSQCAGAAGDGEADTGQ